MENLYTDLSFYPYSLHKVTNLIHTTLHDNLHIYAPSSYPQTSYTCFCILDQSHKLFLCLLYFSFQSFMIISTMSQYCRKEMLEIPFSKKDINTNDHHQWVIMKEYDDANMSESSSSFETFPASTNGSSASSSSLDMVDDASSSSTSCSTSSSSQLNNDNGPLYELSELMAQLPIKRGLSKYFQGKSQSFTSLSKVTSIEDLAKKENSLSRRHKMKACKSYGGGLDHSNRLYTLPKPTISKKSSRNSLSPLSHSTRRGSFMGNFRTSIPVQNNLQC